MDWRVVASQQIVESNYSKPGLTLSEVSKGLGVSPYYLGRMFRRETGLSFHRFLLNTRLRKASEMLTDPLLSIREVAHRVGYEDPSNFCRAFRSHFGLTPRSYFRRAKLASSL
jgi:AraC-like DNA-binding protein